MHFDAGEGPISELVEEIRRSHGTRAIAIPADIADPTSAHYIFTQVERQLGPIDVLVNNAGVTRYNAFEAEDVELRDWWKVIETNLRGPMTLIRAVLPSMLERGCGTIISTASTSGSQDTPFATAYATSKAALIKFHQDLAVEIGDRGVHTYCVHPGTDATNLAKSEGAINMEVMQKTPAMMEILRSFEGMKMQTAELAANTYVALAAGDEFRLLSGMFIDSQHDLGEVLKEAKKDGKGRIGKERLYHLKVDEL